MKIKYTGPDLSAPAPAPALASTLLSDSKSDPDEEAPALPVLSESSFCTDDIVESESDAESYSDADVPPCEVDTDDRLAFFEAARASLASCKSFAELKEMAGNLREQVQNYTLPEPQAKRLMGASIDEISSSLLQPEVRQKVVVISVGSDGNCFYRSLSLLVFGTQWHHLEFRVRCAVAMTSNTDLFLDGWNWCADHDHFDTQEVINIATVMSARFMGTPRLTFEEEVLSVVQNGSYAGLWEFFATSHVLQRPIQSIFPSCGQQAYQLHCNRIIRSINCMHEEKIHVHQPGRGDEQLVSKPFCACGPARQTESSQEGGLPHFAVEQARFCRAGSGNG